MLPSPASNHLVANKICLVTGATAGIGLAVAEALASLGAEVIIHGRNPTKTRAVASQVQTKTGNPRVGFLLSDFEDLKQVRRMADEYKEHYAHLDLLVNNAGAFYMSHRQSVDGIEMTFLVNHLAPFLLTNLLLESIVRKPPARIINVSSGSHWYSDGDFETIHPHREFFGMKTYGRSKLANILFTRELARRLNGTGVTVNAVHPGQVATEIWNKSIPVVGPLIQWVMKRRLLTPVQGADTIVYLAVSPEVEGVTGKYFVNRTEAPSSQQSQDGLLAAQLWSLSEALTGLGQ